MQQPLIWLCTLADVLLILTQQTIIPLSSSAISAIRSTICPSPSTQPVSATVAIHTTSFLLIGALLVLSGSLLRLTCYRTLGVFFTFDLAILPAHRLIVSGPYSVIRHPAYTGSLLMLMGLALANLSPGGWVAECGVFGRGSGSLVVRVGFFAVWYAWWIAVGVRHARKEDAALRRSFGAEWEKYARNVRWWFLPGVL